MALQRGKTCFLVSTFRCNLHVGLHTLILSMHHATEPDLPPKCTQLMKPQMAAFNAATHLVPTCKMTLAIIVINSNCMPLYNP